MYRLDAIAAKLARLERGGFEVAGDGPRAAVAAILRDAGGPCAELLFIRRAERASDPWSGHIAFPGGRREPCDKTLVDTAIRETREEVGVDLASAELLGRLPDVPAFLRPSRRGLVVTPFVFGVRGEVQVSPNCEVAETFWIPFEALARGEGRGTYAFSWDGKSLDVPCIRLPPAEHVLWGMTYRMLETMLEAVAASV